MDGWMDGWMDAWMDGWMDACMFTILNLWYIEPFEGHIQVSKL